MLWSISMIIKLTALLFAWMYVVEAIKYEIATLEASKAAAEARNRGEDSSDAANSALELATHLNGSVPDPDQLDQDRHQTGQQQQPFANAQGRSQYKGQSSVCYELQCKCELQCNLPMLDWCTRLPMPWPAPCAAHL